MNDNFDENLSNVLNSRAAINPEKSITEAAINEAAGKQERKVRSIRPSVRMVAAAMCTIIIGFTGMMAFSEDIRNTASNIVQTIFSLDKDGDSYKIVERDPAEEMSTTNIGGIQIEELDRNEIIDKLGFEPFVPEELGEFKRLRADIGMSLNGKASDLMKLNSTELMQILRNYPNDKRLEGFNARTYFTMGFSKSGNYSDDYTLYLHMAKPLEKPLRDESTFEEKVCQFTYKGVECQCIAQVRADFPREYDGQFTYYDNTKQPKGVIKHKRIYFELDGFRFQAGYIYKDASNLSAFDYDITKKFVENFIDAYKSR